MLYNKIKTGGEMTIHICKTCGYLAFDGAPDNCPVCGMPKDNFIQNDNIFQESRENSPEAEVKHIPAVKVVKACGLIPEDTCTDVHVRIGEVLHPMTEKHLITFIDCYVNDVYAARMMLTANSVNPAAAFHIKETSGKVKIVENCNIHGYWMTEVEL